LLCAYASPAAPEWSRPPSSERLLVYSFLFFRHFVSRMSPLVTRARHRRVLHSQLKMNGTLFIALITASCSAASRQTAQYIPQAAEEMRARLPQPTLTDYVYFEDRIVFTNAIASGSLDVFFDPRGGFVVADRGQNEIRVYSGEPKLLASFGREGSGPGEFQRLRSAVRTSSNEIVAVDNLGKLSIFDSAGTLKRAINTGLNPVSNALLLNDSTLLVSGRQSGKEDTPLLHVWNILADSIVQSFFPTPVHLKAFDGAYRFTGWTHAASRRDTIAVIFPLADTLYLFAIDGSQLQKLPLTLERFHRLQSPPPTNSSPEEEIEWRNSYTRLSAIYWATDGSIYIKYFDIRGFEPVWGLARFEIVNGKAILRFDVPNTLQLLGISPVDSKLYFMAVDELESTWLVGRLIR
jgi:hypothetical protein